MIMGNKCIIANSISLLVLTCLAPIQNVHGQEVNRPAFMSDTPVSPQAAAIKEKIDKDLHRLNHPDLAEFDPRHSKMPKPTPKKELISDLLDQKLSELDRVKKLSQHPSNNLYPSIGTDGPNLVEFYKLPFDVRVIANGVKDTDHINNYINKKFNKPIASNSNQSDISNRKNIADKIAAIKELKNSKKIPNFSEDGYKSVAGLSPKARALANPATATGAGGEYKVSGFHKDDAVVRCGSCSMESHPTPAEKKDCQQACDKAGLPYP